MSRGQRQEGVSSNCHLRCHLIKWQMGYDNNCWSNISPTVRLVNPVIPVCDDKLTTRITDELIHSFRIQGKLVNTYCIKM